MSSRHTLKQRFSRLTQILATRKYHEEELAKLHAEETEIRASLAPLFKDGPVLARNYRYADEVYRIAPLGDSISFEKIPVLNLDEIAEPAAPAPGDVIDPSFEEIAEDTIEVELPDAPPAAEDRGQSSPDEPEEDEALKVVSGELQSASPDAGNEAPYFDDHHPESRALAGVGVGVEAPSTEPAAAFTTVTESDSEVL